MMKKIDVAHLLTQARLLHADLRSCSESTNTHAEKLALYKATRKRLDAAHSAAGEMGREQRQPAFCRVVQELILDSEYHIGTSENGFLPAEGFDHRYELL